MLVGGQVWSGDFSRVVGGRHWPSALDCLWESLFCAGVRLGLLSWGRTHFNRHTVWTRFLADNSFAVYVFHPPILIGLTIVLARASWPPLVKFGVLSALGLGVSLMASHFVLRRLPGLRRIWC